MNQTNHYPQRYDDEISLVELATTLVRRRRVFFAVFGGVLLLAVIFAFFIAGDKREYTTLIQLGEQEQEDGMEPLQSPETVIATINNRWYPELQTAYSEIEGEKLPFEINASNPEETALIKLTSQASPELVERIKKLHQQLVDQVIQRQSELLERQRQTLESRLKSINNYLDQLSALEGAGEAAAAAVQNRVNLVAQLESLEPAETLVVARQSVEQKGTSKVIVLALAIVLGLMLGLFAAFMAEFINHVRNAMGAPSSEP